MDLLASREHSCTELARKLKAKGFDPVSVADVILELGEKNLQSDIRYAESYVQTRAGRGDGPLKIGYQLMRRGVKPETISIVLAEFETEWQEGAATARVKRFGTQLPSDFREKAKQTRFLERRGFSTEQIRAVFKV